MNSRLWRMVRIMVTMLSLTMLVGLAGPASAQDEDPKDDCKQGGWETLITTEGEGFDNQGNCVSYVAADDGVPVPPTIEACTGTPVADIDPSGGDKFAGQLPLDASDSFDPCGRTLSYVWVCYSPQQPQDCEAMRQATASEDVDTYTLTIAVDTTFNIGMTVCVKGTGICSGQVTRTYIGIEKF